MRKVALRTPDGGDDIGRERRYIQTQFIPRERLAPTAKVLVAPFPNLIAFDLQVAGAIIEMDGPGELLPRGNYPTASMLIQVHSVPDRHIVLRAR